MRTYKRKKEEGCSFSEERMKAALEDVLKSKKSIREVARIYGLKYSTLYSRLMGLKKAQDFPVKESRLYMGLKHSDKNTKHSSRQVFTVQEEILLAEYSIKCAKLSYGLTMHQLRELAYSYAVCMNRKIPQSWTDNCKAGKEWATSFIKRHRSLSLRKPENTSTARNINYSKVNIECFYKNLEELMSIHDFQSNPERIWNLDESGLSTVLPSPRIVAPAGTKQVGQVVSYERGQQITIVGIVSASGYFAPPVYLFPRKLVHQQWMEGSPDGSIAIFNGSGWMDDNGFIRTLQHLVNYASPTKDNPILLLLDNHSSHRSFEAIKFSRDHGIHMLSFPPHTTHRVQPLDVSVFGPFKARCKTTFQRWMNSNPGQKITLHNIVRISADAFLSSFSEKNIKSGFSKTGISPLDRTLLINELEELEELSQSISTASENSEDQTLLSQEKPVVKKIIKPPIPSPSIAPEVVRPIFASTPVRPKLTRQTMSSTILTGSPEMAKRKALQKKKEAKEEEAKIKQIKKEEKDEMQSKIGTKIKKTKNTKKVVKKKEQKSKK